MYTATIHAFNNVAGDLKHQVFDVSLIHIFWMDRVHIESRTHNDVNARSTGDLYQGIRIASDSHRSCVDNRTATNFAVLRDFTDSRIEVRQRNVGAVAVVVAPYPSEIFEGYWRIGQNLRSRVFGRSKHEREIDIEVFMRRGRTEFRRGYWTQDGLH